MKDEEDETATATRVPFTVATDRALKDVLEDMRHQENYSLASLVEHLLRVALRSRGWRVEHVGGGRWEYTPPQVH